MKIDLLTAETKLPITFEAISVSYAVELKAKMAKNAKI